MGEYAESTPKEKQNPSKELAREFRWVEIAQISSNAILAIVGVVALCIYSGQLSTMKGQLAQMVSSGQQTDQTLCLLRQQLEQLIKQSGDTHTLAKQATAQAKAAKAIVVKTAAQADATNNLAAQARRSADAAEEDRRPWIGLQGYQCVACTEGPEGIRIERFIVRMGIHLTQVDPTGSVLSHAAGSGGLSQDAGGTGSAV